MDYALEPIAVEKASLEAQQALLQLVFPKATKFTFEYLHWQYVENPEGNVVGYNAFYGETLAAHYATMPIKMSIGGVVRKGVLSLNTATHPEHRGKKLFVTLADKTYSAAVEQGYEFVIGVANANSTHGFLKNLDFYEIAPLDVKVGTGLGILDGFSRCRACRVWDDATMAWRLRNPDQRYYRKGNSILAPMYPFCKALIGRYEFEGQEKSRQFRPVTLHIGLGADYSKGYYVNMPSFIHRSPFNLIFKDLKGWLPRIGRDDIMFNLIDFDVI